MLCFSIVFALFVLFWPGDWVESEHFVVAGEEVVRKQGDRAHPTLMRKWRDLRDREPGLFAGLHIWQQPAAFVDSVIYHWMQQLEAGSAKQVLRLVDMFAGGWSETSQECNFLLQQLQGAVAAGCTATSQVTDTGFASMAKAAAVRQKDELRELMRLKARLEGVQPTYRCGAREILQVAQSMHQAMVDHNTQSNTVLREFRACGWAAWRPQGGRLVDSNTQEWSRQLPEQSSRITAQAREGRHSWLSETGKPLLPNSEADQVDVQKLEVTYCPEEQTAEGAEKSCVLDLDLGWLAGSEREAAAALMLPAKERTVEQQYHLALKAMTSQVKPGVKRKAFQTAVLNREERVQVWKKALGTKTIQDRIGQVLPHASKGNRKVLKPATGSKNKKKKPHWKLSFAKKNLKQVKKVAKEKAAQDQADKETGLGPLVNKMVRVVGWQTSKLLQDLEAKVLKHWEAEQKVLLLLPGTKNATQVLPVSEVSVLTGKEKVRLADKLDLRALKAEEKTEALEAAGGQLQFLQPATMLESPELTAGWVEVLLRGRKQGDKLEPGSLVVTDPQQMDALLFEFQAGNTGGEVWENLLGRGGKLGVAGQQGLWEKLQRAVESQHSSCTLLVPVHSSAPEHWTLLVLKRQATQAEAEPAPWAVECFDSLPKPSQSAFSKAGHLLELLKFLLQPGTVVHSVPVQAAPSRKQSDGWSCGFWVLLWMEQEYRKHRGEGERLLQPEWTQKMQTLNGFFSNLKKHKAAQEAKGKVDHSAGKGTSKGGQGAATELGPPPLPPPATAPGSHQDEKTWGCSRCRWNQRGCLQCSPAKMLKWAQGQTQPEAVQPEMTLEADLMGFD